MKTLKNILEGVITSSDYKLDKKGRKYPAHRRVMEDSNPYLNEGTMRDGKYVDDAPRPGTNEVPIPDEGYRPPKSKPKTLVKKPETKMVDDEDMKEETEVEKTKRQTFIGMMAKKSLPKNSNILKTRTGGSLDQNVEVYEGRGRPKKEMEDDEGEHYDADSGVEADQHIHVQLKKAADSDQKPYEVSFKNGKKHTVSQHVAKNLLSATEKLKPEHRKTVHDEIHKSYDNLLAVHKMVVGK